MKVETYELSCLHLTPHQFMSEARVSLPKSPFLRRAKDYIMEGLGFCPLFPSIYTLMSHLQFLWLWIALECMIKCFVSLLSWKRFLTQLWVMLLSMVWDIKELNSSFLWVFTSLNLFFWIQDTWWTVICSSIDYHQDCFFGSTSWYQLHSFRAGGSLFLSVQVDLRRWRVVDWGDCFLPFRFSGSWGEGLGLLTNMVANQEFCLTALSRMFWDSEAGGRAQKVACAPGTGVLGSYWGICRFRSLPGDRADVCVLRRHSHDH